VKTVDRRSSVFAWSGFAAGSILAFASMAWAKLQCPPVVNIGRSHPAMALSSTVDGSTVTIPPASQAPMLGTRVFKTEYDGFPSTVHAEVFDSFYPNHVRTVHLTKEPQ
jgi:hypothetical protein